MNQPSARAWLRIAWNYARAHRLNRRFQRAYPCRVCGYRYVCPDGECHS